MVERKERIKQRYREIKRRKKETVIETNRQKIDKYRQTDKTEQEEREGRRKSNEDDIINDFFPKNIHSFVIYSVSGQASYVAAGM